jgi:aspartate beta-hydroxylase
MPAADYVPTLYTEASDALFRGDASAAKEQFERIIKAAGTSALAWAGLAAASQRLGDNRAALSAVDRALAIDPRNSQALIVRADLFAEAGDRRAASAHYAAALRNAPPQAQLTPFGVAELRRTRDVCERYAREYEMFLKGKLAQKGFDPEHSSSRFAMSFEMSMGRKKLYLQQPSQYYFPELPQIQFYDRKLFPWMSELEAATDTIVSELQGIMSDEAAFHPYVESDGNRPRRDDDRMTDNRDWTAFYLWKYGEIVEKNAARCPETMRALESVPHCRIAKRTPSVLFSRLRPGAKIPPHNGFINTRLICHLPLIIPEGCGFRVGNDVREWKKGHIWAFDDTIEHEAWNNSSEMRVIMIFEIWRPELSDEERNLVAAMLEAIDDYRGQQVIWTAG